MSICAQRVAGNRPVCLFLHVENTTFLVLSNASFTSTFAFFHLQIECVCPQVPQQNVLIFHSTQISTCRPLSNSFQEGPQELQTLHCDWESLHTVREEKNVPQTATVCYELSLSAMCLSDRLAKRQITYLASTFFRKLRRLCVAAVLSTMPLFEQQVDA